MIIIVSFLLFVAAIVVAIRGCRRTRALQQQINHQIAEKQWYLLFSTQPASKTNKQAEVDEENS